MRRPALLKVARMILFIISLTVSLSLGWVIRTACGAVGEYPGRRLFDDIAGDDHYNYCPSYIQIDSETRYIFYCRNPESGKIIDSIFWRKATRNGNTWNWGPQREALAKGSGWESVHVCDPEVRKGEFKVNGHTYEWVMFYLGCDQLDNNHNQIGLAFADSIEGPWVKWNGNPIVKFPGTGFWGVGQPSATSVDGKGQLLMFYSKGDAAGTRTIYTKVDLSDMSAPDMGQEQTLFKDGLTGKEGSYAILHNASYAYDGNTDRFYIVRCRHPFESLICDFIPSELEVAYTPGTNLWENKGKWVQDGLINPDNTGMYRNHNPGLLTDPYGNLAGGANGYEIAYSVSDSGENYLWSYRLHSIASKDLNHVSKLDDRNFAVKYSGKWDHSEDAGDEFYLQTSKWSTQTGAKANLSFRGGAFEIWGTKSPSHGIFKVYIDGSQVAVVDAYSSTQTGPVKLYRAENLLTGFHMLSVEVAGMKNSASKGYKIDLDYVIVDVSEQSYATPTLPQSESASSASSASVSASESASASHLLSDMVSIFSSEDTSMLSQVEVSDKASEVASPESVENVTEEPYTPSSVVKPGTAVVFAVMAIGASLLIYRLTKSGKSNKNAEK